MIKKVLSVLLVLCMIFSLAACTGGNQGNNQNNSLVNNTNEANNSANTNEAGNDANNSANTNEGGNEAGNNTASNESGNTADPGDPKMQEEFAAFVEKQYVYSIEESYTTAHVYYLDPTSAGLNDDNIEKSFGLASTDEDYEEIRTYYTDLKNELLTFDREKLTRRQQDEYDTLVWEIDSVLAMSDKKFDYYEQYFAPPNSLEANIVSLLSTWELRNEKDVKDFITMMDTLPAYVDSAIEYAKKQQEMKLFMTDFDAVVTGCDDVLKAGMNSFVINRLLGQVDELEDLDDTQKASYKAEMKAMFQRSYLPSFTKIKNGINSLRGGYNNEEGLAAFPNGKEYFEVLLNYGLGSSGVSASSFKRKIEKRMSVHYEVVYDIYGKDQESVSNYYGNSLKTGYESYDDILEDVKKLMLTDHPEVKNLEYMIKLADVEEKLDEKNIAAYFVIPPLDGDHKQQMRVNPSNDEIESIDTYMTVTHEGFPGHMYQYAYLYDLDISDYLKTIGIDGMVEGYAVYAQYGALDYLSDISKNVRKFAAADSSVSYLLYCLIDIGINYDGWTLEDTKKFFDDEGYNVNDESAKEIYDFMRFSPCTYEPYGLGYEYIAEQRERAERALGEKFSAAEFNKAFLNAASAPRDVVKRYIDEYIESAK